ncbi:MAG: hypothetical protein HY644_11915 [Acidobacteria bacterium]|nr:hypothetical protein [Acidobacteriota bacterium]
MRRKVIFIFVLLSVLPSYSQSLGELARKERERREKAGKASRVIRNEDIKNIGNGKVTVTSPPPATEEPAAGEVPSMPPAAMPVAAPPLQDENYWRSAFKEARLDLKLAQNRGLVLELKVNELRNRFFTESDGSTRTLIEQELNKTLADLQTNQAEITKAEESLKKLEEAARKANVPPAWMREEVIPSSAGAPPN